MDEVRKALTRLWQRRTAPDALQLHAWLHRLCGSQVDKLALLCRSRAMERRVVELELQYLQEPDCVAFFMGRLEQALGHPDAALLEAIAALRALDQAHRADRALVHRARVPGLELGAGPTLFLAPTDNPIAQAVPRSRQPVRGDRHQRLRVEHELDLWWRLVQLDAQPMTLQARRMDPGVAYLLEDAWRRFGGLRVGLAAPFRGLRYAVRSRPEASTSLGRPYRFLALEQDCLDDARSALRRILERCVEERVDILCFPELTLDRDLRLALRDLLRAEPARRHPALVLTGSFHLDLTDTLAPANRAEAVDGSGVVLWHQDKRVPYEIPAARAARLPAAQLALLGLDETGGFEEIAPASELQLIDGPLGRLATPICLDFCGAELRELLVDVDVDLILVPAMSASAAPFADRAAELATRCGASTCVANSAWLLNGAGRRDEAVAIAMVPAQAQVWQRVEAEGQDLHVVELPVDVLVGPPPAPRQGHQVEGRSEV